MQPERTRLKLVSRTTTSAKENVKLEPTHQKEVSPQVHSVTAVAPLANIHLRLVLPLTLSVRVVVQSENFHLKLVSPLTASAWEDALLASTPTKQDFLLPRSAEEDAPQEDFHRRLV